jgi:hypothetical protein
MFFELQTHLFSTYFLLCFIKREAKKKEEMKLYVPALLSLASTALAFESTVPLLMWSPKE